MAPATVDGLDHLRPGIKLEGSLQVTVGHGKVLAVLDVQGIGSDPGRQLPVVGTCWYVMPPADG